MTTDWQSVAQQIYRQYGGRQTQGGYQVKCPAHEDKTPSLSVTVADGKLLWKCHGGCSQEAVKDALTRDGLMPKPQVNGSNGGRYREVDVYNYEGFQKVRYEPKTFRCRRKDPEDPGRWIYDIKGVKPTLYLAPRLEIARKDNDVVLLCEGEKDVKNFLETCIKWGLKGYFATTNFEGAAKWKSAYTKQLEGCRVVVCEDNDKAGRERTWMLEKELRGKCELRVIRFTGIEKKGGDLSDWLDEGRTAEEIVELVDSASLLTPPTEVIECPTVGQHDKRTAIANGERFVMQHGQETRHMSSHGWMEWSDTRWHEGAEGRVTQRAKLTARSIRDEAFATDDEDERDDLLKWCRQSQSREGISSMLWAAQSECPIATDYSVFDADPWSLNCANGILDLKRGKLEPHDKSKLCTKQTSANYGEALTADSLWLRFLRDVTDGDKEFEGYLQRVVGYCLTGSVSEKCFFFCYGAGDNGKSVFIETIGSLLGSYATSISTEALIKNRYGSAAADIARLSGPRIATCSETSKGEQWNDALIKDITGGDIITGRYLYKDVFSFRPQAKLIIRGNSKPDVKDNSSGMWSRIQLIPFETFIPPEKRDRYLRDKLERRELNGILTWAVEGCLKWQEIGLSPPDRISAAVSEYREEMDTIGSFLTECVTVDNSGILDVKSSALYASYKSWCVENGHKPISMTALGIEMKSRDYQRVRNMHGWHYKSMRLLKHDTGESGGEMW